MRTLKTKDGKETGFVASYNELTPFQKKQAAPLVRGAWGEDLSDFEVFDFGNQMEFVLAPLSSGLTVVQASLLS